MIYKLTYSSSRKPIDPSTPWPPADPERNFVKYRKLQYNHQSLPPPPSVMMTTALDEDGYVTAFRKRQEKDLLRWRRRRSLGSDGCSDGDDDGDGGSSNVDNWIDSEREVERRGKNGDSWDGIWRNEDGATLEDYGVDEDAEGELGVMGLKGKTVGGSNGENEDDEDLSLAEVLRRKRGQHR